VKLKGRSSTILQVASWQVLNMIYAISVNRPFVSPQLPVYLRINHRLVCVLCSPMAPSCRAMVCYSHVSKHYNLHSSSWKLSPAPSRRAMVCRSHASKHYNLCSSSWKSSPFLLSSKPSPCMNDDNGLLHIELTIAHKVCLLVWPCQLPTSCFR
jgi:hypothetical protein